ncbi:MAG: hypothetical protein A3E78_01250 [Alphaproteobacteria bacterium RIFCSPHIGHO2_12_FULL_63_12]|nr:MAG: hypothetical protein A3E78_01250 [Alphaproteobacteria bacterium RIFCSPHIGHO2_12_FULL_63_12]
MSEFIQSDDRRISFSLLQSAQILLTESRACLDFLLGEVLFATQTRKITTYQLSHIHAGRLAIYIL